MVMVWILWCILASLILFFFYLFIKTTATPNRKFRHAVKQKQFYMVDDKNNVRKNLLLTFKGVILEGEKHPGTSKNSLDVGSIYIWTWNPADIEKMDLADFFFIEQKILKQYPKAKINWNNPFFKLMS
jgi:hypothetical protein